MQELAQADPRVERMMQLESLFTKDPNLLRDYFFYSTSCNDNAALTSFILTSATPVL